MGESYCFKTFSTTNNSGPMYGVFLPVVISTLIRTSYVGSPLFQGSIIYNPSSSCSPTPLLASNHLFIVWNRWWHVTKYPAAAIPVNYPPTHTSTNRQTKWSYIHIFKVVSSWPIFTSLRRASGFVRIFMQAVCEK